MNKINFFSVLFVFLLSFSACLPEQHQQANKKFFDLKKVMAKQIQMLSKCNAKVRKNAQIMGKRKEENLPINWESELKIFLDSDINLPILWENYSVVKTDKSLIYKALKDNLKVRELEIYSTENFADLKDLENKVSEIKIAYRDENSFYFTKRNLAIQFDKGIAQTYQIIGFQKIMFKDTLDYQVSAEILK